MKTFNRIIGDTETFNQVYRFKNPDGSEQNLSGHTVRLVISKNGVDKQTFPSTIVGGVATFAGVLPTFTGYVSGKYRYRIEHVSGGNITWVIGGDWLVKAE